MILDSTIPVIQEPPFWFSAQFAWIVWILLWTGAGIIVAGAVLYYFFKRLLSLIS